MLDRLIEEVTPEGTVTYAYDDANRRATMTVAGQSTVSYTYDDADRLTLEAGQPRRSLLLPLQG